MNEFKRSRGGGLQLEIDPTGSFGIDPLIREIYGRTRMKALVEYVVSMPRNSFTHRRLPGRGRVEASMEHIFGAPPQFPLPRLPPPRTGP